MTLVHTVGWYRRRALDPRLDAWPIGTLLTSDDVIVVGQSLVEAVESVGTPLVRVGEAFAPSADGRFCCAIVTRVEAVLPAESGPGEEIWIDAELDGCDVVATSAALIGRAPTRMRRHYAVRPARTPGELHLALPGDVHAGDLVALACRAPVALHHIRRRAHHPERLEG